MSLPSIQSDGKVTTVFMDNLTLWFSYTTLIAFSAGGEQVVHENIWSNATGKHLNAIDRGNKAARVKAPEFIRKYKELTTPLEKMGGPMFG